MVSLRKALAGSCNLGYTWPEDGAVVEVTPEHAAELLAIPHNDFTVVDQPAVEPEQIEEPAPNAEINEAPPARQAKKTTSRKSPTAPSTVEE